MMRTTVISLQLAASVMVCPAVGAGQDSQTQETRTARGLVAFYDFTGEGRSIADRSGHTPPLDLMITDPSAASMKNGRLTVSKPVVIRSTKATSRLIRSVRRTNELTIEVWAKPARLDQTGPARIVTLSKDPNQRNFTLGQDKNRVEGRFRTTTTSANGVPSVPSLPGSLKAELTHIAICRQRDGKVHIYLNGERSFQGNADGDFSNWGNDMAFGLANELDGSRPWLGTLRMVAVFNRALSAREVKRHFLAGPDAQPGIRPDIMTKANPAARHFETRIAPLIAHHCLECHDAASHKGGLVLSTKQGVFAGGESGTAIVKGKSSDSLLWQSVESNDMPQDREPLSDEEKKLLREWLDSGAEWSLETLDPAIYAHGGDTGKTFVRRLTVAEYVETVRAAVGVDIEAEARKLLPPDLRADGFSNTAYNLTVDLQHVDAFAKLAETIVRRMDVDAFTNRFSRKRDFTQNVMRPLIAKMGEWLYRSPLTDAEVTALRGITTSVASAGGTVDEAIGLVIEAMLQSPRFLYRIENQRGDGTPIYADAFELASRMSYIVWGGPPDQELLKAASTGALHPEAVREQLQRMLADPKARAHSLRFASEWLDLDRLDNLQPNGNRFPGWNAQLADDMRRETLAFFEEIVWNQNRPLSHLLNAQVSFLSPELAAHYGFAAQGDGFRKYDLSSVPSRGGLLTHGSVLTVGGDDASMVTRGLFVMHELLRGVVKDPPPCVDTTPTPTSKGVTNRSVALERIGNSACGGCHSKFEPLAFGLEKFDGLGAFHDEDEHGNPLRDDGRILFPGRAEPVPYRSAAELMDLLAASDRVRESITWKVTQFAVGRPLGAEDARVLAAIHDEAVRNGGTYQSLLTAIVLSDLVQMTRTENDE